MLFRGEQVKKRISVLSGGERARLCLAGLLLGQANVLVLDEPGNHLDVETVEALATALERYQGTVIFTSHDRHFLKRVATCVVEVRDGRVMNYQGDYDSYVYSVNQEIAVGERELARGRETGGKKEASSGQSDRAKRGDDRQLRKELANLEKTIARYSDQKTELNSRLLHSTDPAEALRLHNELNDIVKRLDQAESRWLEVQDALEAGRSK